MGQPEDLVLAHSAETPSEAELIRGILESEGIFAVIPDKNNPLPAIDLTPFNGSYSALGCEVLVAAKDLERARQIIREARESGLSDSGDDDAEEGDAEEGDAEEGG